jgi:hypothetical protein
VQIPLLEAGVAITQTPMISYLEQLGLMTEIKVFISDPDTISSPCLGERVDDGEVLVVADAYSVDASTGFASDAASNTEISSTVAFISRFDSFLPFDTKIVISASDEGPNAAIFEWVDFFAAFFNQEALANQVVDAANTRFDCIAGNAGLISTDSQDKPVVFWAYYSGYCSGWSVAKCNDGNYYCEYAEACQADIISSLDGSITDGPCGSIYFTTEEMFELGKDADHWIYPAENWDETYENNKKLLNKMESVKNEQVFDYLGTSQSGWFEQRLAQYYDVLDDFCTIVGTTSIFDRERVFFRNVFTEPIGAMGECVDPGQSLILNDITTCVPNVITAGQGSSASTLQSGKNIFCVGLVLAVASLFA